MVMKMKIFELYDKIEGFKDLFKKKIHCELIFEI